jgi:hypothetical protein
MDPNTLERLAHSLAARLIPRIEQLYGRGNGMVPLTMDSKAAAALLGISIRALWHLKQRGLIPFIRVNRRVMYERLELETWIKRHRVQRLKKGSEPSQR